MTKITMDGKYQTRDGRPVRVLCVDADGDYPVVALAGGCVYTYTLEGKVLIGTAEGADDLIPVPEKRRVKFWVNVYEPLRSSVIHADKDNAEASASPDRLACLEIDREFTVGEGL